MDLLNKIKKNIQRLIIKFSLKEKISFQKIEAFIKKDLQEIEQNEHAKKLVVIPSESLKAYKDAGYDWLERYYNPNKYFDKVYLLSPKENGFFYAHGMSVIQVDNKNYQKALKLINPDIIRSYGGYWATSFAVKNKVDEIPIVASIHDTNENLLFKEIKEVDYAICMSKIVAQMVENRGLNKNKIMILPNRVDRKIFSHKLDENVTKYIFDSKYKNILLVGRRAEQKNIEAVIESLKYLPDNYRLIQIGQGDKKQYNRLIQENNLQNKCVFIDSVKNSYLPYFYSKADVLCNPSLWEGFGIVLIEAAACETPIITSNIAPMNEYFTNEKDALLLDDYKNPKTIAQAILKICENKECTKTMGKNARIMTEKFDLSEINNQEIDIYKKIIDEQRI